MNPQAVTLARYYARQQVKAELQASGINPWRVEPADITRLAWAYLDQHPELIERAEASPILSVRKPTRNRTLARTRARNPEGILR